MYFFGGLVAHPNIQRFTPGSGLQQAAAFVGASFRDSRCMEHSHHIHFEESNAAAPNLLWNPKVCVAGASDAAQMQSRLQFYSANLLAGAPPAEVAATARPDAAQVQSRLQFYCQILLKMSGNAGGPAAAGCTNCELYCRVATVCAVLAYM